MTPRLVPMLSPDGQVGDVPVERVAEAQKAGFKLGAELEKDGQIGVVPVDRVVDALKAGFKRRNVSSSDVASASVKQPVKVMYDQERQNAEAIKRGGIGYDTSGMESANLDLGETAKYAAGSALAVGSMGAGTVPQAGRVAAALKAAAASPLGTKVIGGVARGAAEAAGIGAVAKYLHLLEPRK